MEYDQRSFKHRLSKFSGHTPLLMAWMVLIPSLFTQIFLGVQDVTAISKSSFLKTSVSAAQSKSKAEHRRQFLHAGIRVENNRTFFQAHKYTLYILPSIHNVEPCFRSGIRKRRIHVWC